MKVEYVFRRIMLPFPWNIYIHPEILVALTSYYCSLDEKNSTQLYYSEITCADLKIEANQLNKNSQLQFCRILCLYMWHSVNIDIISVDFNLLYLENENYIETELNRLWIRSWKNPATLREPCLQMFNEILEYHGIADMRSILC